MPPARPFACNRCSRAFTRSENLERHKRSYHDSANAPKFECPRCHAQFGRRDVCKRHAANCSNRRETSQPPVQAAALNTIEAHKIPPVIDSDLDIRNAMFEDNISLGVHDSAVNDPGTSFGITADHNADWIDSSSSHSMLTSVLSSLPVDSTHRAIQYYVDYFHSSLPIIHCPTLNSQSTAPILLKAVMSIGLLYLAEIEKSPSRGADNIMSKNLWGSGITELERIVRLDPQMFRTPWVLQSSILYIIYGTFTGNEQYLTKARDIYRFMTDSLRELELLHQKSVYPPGSAWDSHLGLSVTPDEVRHKWQLYIDQESIKMSLYAFYYFDYHLFTSLNMRPTVSSIEFDWELPLSVSLWEAESSQDWWHAVLQRQLDLESSRSEVSMMDEGSYQIKSILVATQSLFSNTASPVLTMSLSSSPFATLCIVSNIESLLRDFTRCYYQLPPALADPSPFHVLTQSQNAQVTAALRSILSIIAEGPCSACNEGCRSLWHAVKMGCLSIQISLCKPDDLLVGGIIEGSITAALATTVHLTLGNYVAARRSGTASRRKFIAEDGSIAVLDSMLTAMHEMSISKVQAGAWEGPWITVQGFKLLILLWQALRFSIAELQSRETASPNLDNWNKIYDPAKVVVHAVITALDLYDREEEHVSHESLATLEGLDNAEKLDIQYIRWFRKLCDRRHVWTIGPSMERVLDEICAMDSISEH